MMGLPCLLTSIYCHPADSIVSAWLGADLFAAAVELGDVEPFLARGTATPFVSAAQREGCPDPHVDGSERTIMTSTAAVESDRHLRSAQ